MENTTAGGSASRKVKTPQKNGDDLTAQAAKSLPPLKPPLMPDPAPDGIGQAELPLSDCAAALSLLQSAFDQSLELGLKAKINQTPQTPQTPKIVTLELWGVSICPKCDSWMEGSCVVCG
jgi:hypothetical protein